MTDGTVELTTAAPVTRRDACEPKRASSCLIGAVSA